MSIRRSLELEHDMAQSEVVLSSYHPDRVVLTSQELIDDCSDFLKEDENEYYVPLHNVWRVDIQDDHRSDATYWINEAVSESRWAYDLYWETEGGNAWFVHDRLVINAKFTLTLSERIMSVPSTMSMYSFDMGSWVIVGPVMDDGSLMSLLDDYGISPSPSLRSRLEGREDWKKYLDRHVRDAHDANLRVPNSFPTNRSLRDHQVEASLGLAGLGSGLLADQVGLGKGGSFISGFLSRVQHVEESVQSPLHEDKYPLVVITTKSLKYEIAEEIVQWKQDAQIEILEGTSPARIDSKSEFVVLNIDLLSARLEDIFEVDPVGVIVDEAHTLKNENAQRTKSAKNLVKSVRDSYGDQAYIVLASGTPFLNRPIELWSILNILDIHTIFSEHARQFTGDWMKIRTVNGWKKGRISHKRAFEIRWCNGHYDKFGNWHNEGASNTAELNKLLLQNAMIRRKKSDIISPLPELHENLVVIDPDPKHYDDYRKIEKDFVEWMKIKAREEAEEQGISVADALRIVYAKLENAYGAMRMTALRQSIAKCKLKGIREWVHRFMKGDPEIIGEDDTRHKLILFAYHKDTQESLINDPELKQYGMVSIVSGQDDTSIQEGKRLFQTDRRCRLMICYSGAREGHTLTAAKDVALAETVYVPTWVIQMAGRCWARMSEEYEPHEAYVHHLVSPGTIDSVLINKARMKKAVFNAVIDGEDVQELTSDDTSSEDQANLLLELMSQGHKSVGIAN